MKTLLTLLISLVAFTATTHANYDWLTESLEPVSDCQWVTGAIVHEAVIVNVLCPEHDENGELVWTEKSIYIDLIAKTWRRDNWWFELLSSNQQNG